MGRKGQKRKKAPSISGSAPTPEPEQFPAEPASISVDGSLHEGGGQMVRTALGLAAAQGASVEVVNVRAGRATPGLRLQHVAGAVLCGTAAGGSVSGARVGSGKVRYDPSSEAASAAGPLRAAVGSAGATALVLQAALPALALRAPGVEVTLSGGTHVPASPTADYVKHVLIPTTRRFGVRIRYDVGRAGFFPRGGGEVKAAVGVEGDRVVPWRQTRRAEVVRVRGWVVPASLAFVRSGAADRMRAGARKVLRTGLGTDFERCGGDAFEVEVVPVDAAAQAGASLSITLVADTADGGAIGASLTLDPRAAREFVPGAGRRDDVIDEAAELVGAQVAEELVADVKSSACVDRHMADQIGILMAMADGESSVTVPAVSRHMKSVQEVLKRFGVPLAFEPEEGGNEPVFKMVCPGKTPRTEEP